MADYTSTTSAVKKPIAASYTTTPADPYFGAYSPEDIAASQKQGLKDAGIAAGIGAASSLAEIGLSAIPTAADNENRKRLDELAKHKGLSGGERADIDEQAMRGVRALATESQARDEGALAASGQHSAASLQRVRSSNADALNRAAIAAADIGIQANQRKVAQDTQEEQERISYKGDRQREKIKYAIDGINGLASLAGPVLAAQPDRVMPTEAQFRAMQRAKDPDGNAMYAGLQGLGYDEWLRNWKDRYKAARRPDGAVLPQ